MEEERELRFFKNERTLQELHDSTRKGNIMILGIPEIKSLLKDLFDENFPT